MESERKNEKCVIILLGAPGSGKGTQAKNISRAKNLPHISTGELFRSNISQNTKLGVVAQDFINQGQLVPDKIVLQMLYERIKQSDCEHGYLLDGFPRTIPQADYLQESLSADTLLFVINLEVSSEVILQRISGRLSCAQCGNIQNRYFNAPKKEGVCDRCGASFFQREDDLPNVVEERLKAYFSLTAPLIDYYRNKGVLYTFNGELDPEDLFFQIMNKVNLFVL